MRMHEASCNSKTKDDCSFQIKESKDVLTEELEEEPIEGPVVEYAPQSSPKSDTDDSEEPEEDPEEELEEEELEEEELEEELEEDPEGDPEEESSVEPDEGPAEDQDEDDSKEIASKLSSQSGIDGNEHKSESNHNHNYSKEKKRSLDATASDSDLFQVNQSQKKFSQEEDAFKGESDVRSSVTDLRGKSVVSEAILNDGSVAEQQEHTGSSGKRRRSRWEPQPEQDGKTGEGSETSKRRKTRWASDLPQLKMVGPIQLPDFMEGFVGYELDPEFQELKFKLSEINSKLLSSELHDERPEEERSPSPQPEHNNLGIRTNTQEFGLRKRLLKERRSIISKLIKKNPTFKTPPDYKRPKLFKKLYIPVKEYPTYNFVGLIMGPRGNTQKRLEKETGAKILLRGKGSMKRSQKHDASDDEDLHVYIEAQNQKSVDAAVNMVEKLLIPIDEGMNDFKRSQLEELAKLNGTDRNGICTVCKEVGHKQYACPQRKSTFKMAITCATCGSFCHPTSSCPLIASPQVGNSLCGSSGLGGGSIPNTKNPKPNKEISGARLYVCYLPQTVDENRLKDLFCPFGKIADVKVIKDRITGFSKGYGFVNFESSVDAAMALSHMNGQKMEGKMLAVRVAGRPQVGGSSVLSHLPMYPGPAAISAAVSSQTAWPGPPGSVLPEAHTSFPKNEGLGWPSSSISLGHNNHLPENKVMNILPSVVSSHAGSKHASSFDSFYRYPNHISLSSPGLLPQFPGDPDYPGSQFL